MGRPRKVKPEEIEVKNATDPLNEPKPEKIIDYRDLEIKEPEIITNPTDKPIEITYPSNLDDKHTISVKQSLNKEIPYYQKPKEGNYCKCGEEIRKNSFSGMCIDCFDAEFNFKNK